MTKAKIYYFTLTDEMLKEEKLHWFDNIKLQDIPFEKINPSNKNNWINLADNDFEELLPLADKKSKKVLFDLYSNGVATNRDEWVYDFDKNTLIDKMKFFSNVYNKCVSNQKIDDSIKWSRDLRNKFNRRDLSKFDKSLVIETFYRPFVINNFYSEKIFNDVLTQNHFEYFGKKLDLNNLVINSNGNGKDVRVLISNKISDLHFTGDTKMLSLYRYDTHGNRQDNITKWGLSQFTTHYKDDSITKEAIFYYTYAVLHYPAYRKKYELNLKREFPRLPFYKDFWKWSAWGKQLMDLHLEYETVEPYELKRIDKVKAQKPNTLLQEDEPTPETIKRKVSVKLKADKDRGIIEIDADTRLEGVPDIAWTYKLGNRSALEWILDQYKERKPKDKTIREKFNTYQFADYKEQVIDLLQRVCTVSVQTMKLIEEMKA